MERARWSCVNDFRCGFFEGGGCLFLFVIVDSIFTVVFCRLLGRKFSPSSSSPSSSSRARLLDTRAGNSAVGELEETDAIVRARLWYVFLTVVAMAGTVVGFKWCCGVLIVLRTPNAAPLRLWQPSSYMKG